MTYKYIAFASVLSAAAAAAWVFPLRVLAKTATTPATITLRDAAGDQMFSDGSGAYLNGVSGASVFFQSGGNVELDLSASSRVVNLNFSTPDTSLNQNMGLNPNAALFTGPKHVTVTQGVLNPDGTCCTATGLLGMTVGQVAQSFLAINFVNNAGASCHLIFGKPAPGYGYTNDATVVANSNGAWTLTTFATDVAKLTCDGKGSTTIVEGYFNLPTQLLIGKM